MIRAAPAAGLAMACDASGRVCRVLRDALGLEHRLAVGALFSAAVDAASVDKIAAFFAAIARDGAAFDWEVNASIDGALRPLHCLGIAIDGRVLVVAAPTNAEATRVYDELAGIDDELGTALRAATQAVRVPTRASDAMYDEITHLNNDLVTTQRELAKANAQLRRCTSRRTSCSAWRRTTCAIRSARSRPTASSCSIPICRSPPSSASSSASSATSSLFMLHLIEDLLDVAQVEAGKLTLERAPTDLTALVERCVAINRVLAARKSIRLVCHCAADLPPADVDPGKISQVLVNLLTNALKFSHPETEVAIDLRRRDDELILTVRDQGQGIPEAEARSPVRRLRKHQRATDGRRAQHRPGPRHRAAHRRRTRRADLGGEPGRTRVDVLGGPADRRGSGGGRRRRRAARRCASWPPTTTRSIAASIARLLEKLGHVTVLVDDGRQALEGLASGRLRRHSARRRDARDGRPAGRGRNPRGGGGRRSCPHPRHHWPHRCRQPCALHRRRHGRLGEQTAPARGPGGGAGAGHAPSVLRGGGVGRRPGSGCSSPCGSAATGRLGARGRGRAGSERNAPKCRDFPYAPRRRRTVAIPKVNRRTIAASTPRRDSAGAVAVDCEHSPGLPGLLHDCPGGHDGSAQHVS